MSRRTKRTLAIAILAVTMGLTAILGGCTAPLMNDVTTDLVDPPRFTYAPTLPANKGREFTYPAPFVEKMRESYPDVRSREIAEPPAQAFDYALAMAKTMTRWEITYVNREGLVFEGVATTRVMRFRDDFVVRVRAIEGQPGTSRIDMRSKSRVGKSDLGTNAKRIRGFFEALGKATTDTPASSS